MLQPRVCILMIIFWVRNCLSYLFWGTSSFPFFTIMLSDFLNLSLYLIVSSMKLFLFFLLLFESIEYLPTALSRMSWVLLSNLMSRYCFRPSTLSRKLWHYFQNRGFVWIISYPCIICAYVWTFCIGFSFTAAKSYSDYISFLFCLRSYFLFSFYQEGQFLS